MNATPAAMPTSTPVSVEHRLSLDGSSVAQNSTTRSSMWGTQDSMLRHQQWTSQEAALLAAAVQLQSGQQSTVSPADLVAHLEQISLMEGANVMSADPGNGPSSLRAPVNEQVVQLLLILLKEAAHKQQSQEHQARKSLDGPAFTARQNRASLESMLCQASSRLQPCMARPSFDDNLPRMSFNMLSSIGTTQPIQEHQESVEAIPYIPTPAMGRISHDSNLPDFILHDTSARAPSMDSNISETLGLARAGRMSVDSCSSLLSGDRRLSTDTSADAYRLAALQGDRLAVGGMPEAFVPRYESRLSVDSMLPDNRIYQSGIPHIPAVNLPAGN